MDEPQEHESAPASLDLTGYRCPVPVIRLGAVLRKLPAGAQVTVFADDPVATVDIPQFCREAGHGCEPRPAAPGTCVFLVTRGPEPA